MTDFVCLVEAVQELPLYVDVVLNSRFATTLRDKLLDTKGVYGSRFSGAGFGGCVVALVDGTRDEDVRRAL